MITKKHEFTLKELRKRFDAWKVENMKSLEYIEKIFWAHDDIFNMFSGHHRANSTLLHLAESGRQKSPSNCAELTSKMPFRAFPRTSAAVFETANKYRNAHTDPSIQAEWATLSERSTAEWVQLFKQELQPTATLLEDVRVLDAKLINELMADPVFLKAKLEAELKGQSSQAVVPFECKKQLDKIVKMTASVKGLHRDKVWRLDNWRRENNRKDFEASQADWLEAKKIEVQKEVAIINVDVEKLTPNTKVRSKTLKRSVQKMTPGKCVLALQTNDSKSFTLPSKERKFQFTEKRSMPPINFSDLENLSYDRFVDLAFGITTDALEPYRAGPESMAAQSQRVEADWQTPESPRTLRPLKYTREWSARARVAKAEARLADAQEGLQNVRDSGGKMPGYLKPLKYGKRS